MASLLLMERAQYLPLLRSLQQLSQRDQQQHLRTLIKSDLFFLLVYGLGRKDADSDWCFERCREVQADPDGRLDLWAREHYKSTIITYALTIQNVLINPEVTVGIFSHTRPIAKGFLQQIKRELERNELLKELFPDVLWDNPASQASKWSEDGGLIVKRNGNPKEATIEAWGLVDGQPTGKHFWLMVYDDTVTRESVTTPEMIKKVTEAWELSRNLGSEGGKTRYIGTRYHFNDTYAVMMQRGIKPRIYKATRDGSIEGEPVLLSRERIAEKRREMGSYTFGCQMLQDPKADSTQGFKTDWLRYFKTPNSTGLNVWMMVDAASSKKPGSDYTAIAVVGAGADSNLYVLDLVRDRLNLTERARRVIQMHRKWKPLRTGYERYGMMADIEYLKECQERENYRFEITELGGQQPKEDRIRRLIPLFESGRLYIPETLPKVDHEGRSKDLVRALVDEEIEPFPVGGHDDMIDAISRVYDLLPNGIEWPKEDDDWDNRARSSRASNTSWLAI